MTNRSAFFQLSDCNNHALHSSTIVSLFKRGLTSITPVGNLFSYKRCNPAVFGTLNKSNMIILINLSQIKMKCCTAFSKG